MAVPTVLFDLDGTLVDTAYLHTLAWWRALEDCDEHVAMATLQPLIGLASAELLRRLLGRDDEHVAELHGRNFAEMYPYVRPLPGAQEIVRRVHERGGRAVIVTAAKQRDLDTLLDALDCTDAIYEIVSAGADTGGAAGKPAPDLFSLALHRAAGEPAAALVLGDSVWDVQAARRAGIEAVAVRTGGTAAERLVEAGAGAVYESCAELLDVWPTTALAALLDGGVVRPTEPPGKLGPASRPRVATGSHGPEATRQLELEHERARRFVADLRTMSDDRSRREAFVELVAHLSAHEASEETAVYPVLSQIEGGRALRREALAQEAELKGALARAMRRSTWRPRGRSFERQLDRIAEILEAHAHFEEERIFPLVRSARTADQRQIMGAWVEHTQRMAPLRPHPHAPQRLPGLVALGPALAFVDRTRRVGAAPGGTMTSVSSGGGTAEASAKAAALARLPGVRELTERRGDEDVKLRQVADHLVDFAARHPEDREVVDRFGWYLADVERRDHDHGAAAGSAGG